MPAIHPSASILAASAGLCLSLQAASAQPVSKGPSGTTVTVPERVVWEVDGTMRVLTTEVPIPGGHDVKEVLPNRVRVFEARENGVMRPGIYKRNATGKQIQAVHYPRLLRVTLNGRGEYVVHWISGVALYSGEGLPPGAEVEVPDSRDTLVEYVVAEPEWPSPAQARPVAATRPPAQRATWDLLGAAVLADGTGARAGGAGGLGPATAATSRAGNSGARRPPPGTAATAFGARPGTPERRPAGSAAHRSAPLTRVINLPT